MKTKEEIKKFYTDRSYEAIPLNDNKLEINNKKFVISLEDFNSAFERAFDSGYIAGLDFCIKELQ